MNAAKTQKTLKEILNPPEKKLLRENNITPAKTNAPI